MNFTESASLTLSQVNLFQAIRDFSAAFGSELCRLAKDDKKICAITAAMTTGTGLAEFSQKYKERFFDVGIAEEHAVTFGCGLASKGMRPVFAVYSTFLQRSYDQLIHDAAIGELHLVLAVDRAGIVGDDGETHQGVFDVSMLNTIPNTVIFFTVIFRGYEKSSQPSNLCLQGSCRYTLPREEANCTGRRISARKALILIFTEILNVIS